MSSPGVTLSGTIQSVAGAGSAGSVVITLVNFGDNPPLVSGTMLAAPVSITVQAAANGTWSTALWGNYQLSPSNTYYQIQIVPSGASGPAWVATYQFNTAGSIDLSTQTPVTTYSVPVPPFVLSGIIAQNAPANKYFNGINSSGTFAYGNPLGTVVLAESYTGSDWGAKVNAADTALGATQGEIWMTQNAGTSAPASDITLNTGHVLRFMQSGTYSLGSSRIIIPGAGSDSAVIGSPSGTLLNYTGNGSAILIGSTSADTYRVTIQNIQLQLQSAGSSAVGISGYRVWWPLIRDCMVLSNNGGSVDNGQTAMLFDGTGNQCVYIRIENPIVAGCFTSGLVFQNTAGLNSLVTGGSFVSETLSVQSGSTGVSYDSTSGENRMLATDFEGWGTGIYCNGQDNWLNARTENCTVNVKFDTSSRANFFIGTALNVPTDNGTFNGWQLTPGVGQANGTKLQAVVVAGPGSNAGSPAPLSFSGGAAWQEDSAGSVISQRNGTTSQEYRIFTQYSNPNFQYLKLAGNYAGSQPGISVVGGGTFANSDLFLSALGTGVVRLQSPLVSPTHTPSSSSDAGQPGQWAWDSSYIYVATGTNTWKRVAISTW